ncbi:cytochrome b/b6 domain-containing protein [Castellaniella sp.]|uniref:cytochrome b/b6 domain-containing protein n=1 Tax=Castellaniella sp. TaxID=1955812 RepID=UPI003A93DAA7
MSTEPERIQRHGSAVRVAHGVNAVVVIALIATGLALGDQLPAALVATLGGHALVNEIHRLGGVTFATILLLAIGLFHSSTRSLIRDLVYFRRGERRWPQAFLKCILSPAHRRTAFHNGRFDPAQRLILLLLACSTALITATGVYLYILPAAPQWVFLVAIRIHIYGAWVAIIALCLHAFAGLGVLHTHRGLLGAMFGDGTVPMQTARTLWPDWTQKKLHDLKGGNPHGPPSHTPS